MGEYRLWDMTTVDGDHFDPLLVSHGPPPTTHTLADAFIGIVTICVLYDAAQATGPPVRVWSPSLYTYAPETRWARGTW